MMMKIPIVKFGKMVIRAKNIVDILWRILFLLQDIYKPVSCLSFIFKLEIDLFRKEPDIGIHVGLKFNK